MNFAEEVYLMRRYRSGYIEAFLNIRHTDIDIEIPVGKTIY